MLITKLTNLYQENINRQPLYLRSLLKEAIQYYVLNFIFTGKWGKMLLFKGGTALRFCFDLPRLSEDLDFDIEAGNVFDLNQFTRDLKIYFKNDLAYDDLIIKSAGNKRTLYLKFPILKQIGLPITSTDSNVLHIRLDFSQNQYANVNSGISIINAGNLSFAVRRYSIEDLFSGKIAAILTREKLEGKEKIARFKGRDYFDLIWYLQKNIKPNWDKITQDTKLSKKQTLELLKEKISIVQKSDLEDDLIPFLQDKSSVTSFAENFQALAQEYLKRLD